MLINIPITLGILTLDQKSSKCSFIFEGLYFEYRIPNSVNIPICALSRPKRKLVCIRNKENIELEVIAIHIKDFETIVIRRNFFLSKKNFT